MKKIGLIFLGVLLPLLLVEFLLRITGYGQLRPTLQFDINTRTNLEAGIFIRDQYLFWRHGAAEPTEFDRKIKAVFQNTSLPEKNEKFRIICLGDSCTRLTIQGWPYSFLLESILGSRRVEVFNASVPGYTSHQGLTWLRRQLLAYNPDLVVVYLGWNDHWRSTRMTDREYAAFLSPWQLRLLSLFKRRTDSPPLRVSLEDFQENLLKIADLVESRGGQTLLVTGPEHITDVGRQRLVSDRYLQPMDDPIQLHQNYMNVVRGLSNRTNIKIFDAEDIFKLLGEPQLLLHLDGIHPTDLGHAVLGAQLADYIASHYLGSSQRQIAPLVRGLIVLAQNQAAEGDWEDAVSYYRRAVELDPEERGSRLGLAWLLATCPESEWRNGQEALALLQLDEGAPDPSPQMLDVRAAALAEVGRFGEAVDLARQALTLCEIQGRFPQEFIAGIRKRLALYEVGRPYRLTSSSGS